MRAMGPLLAACLLAVAGIAAAQDVQVQSWWPENPTKSFFPGKQASLVLGVKNTGTAALNVTYAAANLASPYNASMTMFNFTGVYLGDVPLGPNDETTAEYGIMFPRQLPPREFVLKVTLYTTGPAGIASHLFFNETINVIEEPTWFDTQLLGLYIIGLALLAGAVYTAVEFARGKGWVKRSKPTARPTAASSNKEEWLRGTAADPKLRKKHWELSAMGRRKSSGASGSERGDADSLNGSLDYPGGSRASGGGRRGGRGADPDFDEELLEVDQFDVAVEQLYEKRATTREAALSTIVSLLAQYGYDDCAFRQDTLTSLFLSSTRRGKEVEAALAAKALGLHVTTLGASTASEGIYQEAEPVLEPLILSGKGGTARVAAIDALTMLCFVGAEGAADTLHTMATLWRVVMAGWKKAASAAAVVAALRSWAFLLSTVPTHRLDSHFVESYLGQLAQLLNGGDVEVRCAAGEAIALLWTMADLSSLPESPRPSTQRSRNGSALCDTLAAMAVGSPPKAAAPGANRGGEAAAAEEGGGGEPAAAQQQQQQRPTAAARQPDEGGEDDEDDEGVDSLEAIVERMRDLAKNRGDASRLNKGDRAASRSTFRDLLAIIEGEHVPETKIKLRHGDVLMVTGLLDNIRLNYLRAFLAEAFQAHMQANELLHEVFRFSPADEPEERLTPLEKRLFRSKSSSDMRDRSALRQKERATMASYKHGSLAD
ncbi:Interferon-related developmental regulator 1 [Micractinium conductrix]|uniref:Interferon-related developmental regulator 1 n=1 Tax=Micractinium conductrix TaxID=554055 RepID=A0A2P6V2B3_9CHLO|nr:Interferon-related developmental regulator 1 [Micractinium conductrix]|eukprot:PSC68232.1 Interferon-related developmental regulator 1 [Micractinium conductrix]